MSEDQSTGDAILGVAGKLAGSLLPELISWIVDLIRKGHSEEEILEIVNIKSRRAQYEREKLEDEQALEDKWSDDE